MNSQDFRNLQEAYLSVYAPQKLDEISVNKMLAYVEKGEKNRADLNKKWDKGTATHRERMRVLGREEGEERASEKIKKKTGKRPYEMNALDKARYAVTKEDYMDEEQSPIPRGTPMNKRWPYISNKDPEFQTALDRVNKKKSKKTGVSEDYMNEAEGSYGQTPKAQQKMGDLANKRRNTPASEYSERGEKKKKVDSASRHFNRMGNPDAGNKGKKSSRPYYPAGRKGMTQKDRDWSRGADEYGHSGYDGEGGGGSLPKGKKLERQRKTGVSAESFDLYDIILSHLLDEGYADTQKAAEAIMVNMSEDWRESIVETRMDPRGRPASGPMNVYGKSKPNTDPAFQAALKSVREKEAKKTPEQRKAELDAYKARQMNR